MYIRSEHPTTGASVTLSGFAVELAVVAASDTVDAEPEEGDWQDAAWESGTKTIAGRAHYGATVGFGTGSLDLAVGVYRLWARVTAGSYVPVVRGPKITVIEN